MKVKLKISYLLLVITCLMGSFTLTPRQARAATKFQVVNVTNTTKKVGDVTFSSQYAQSDSRWNVYYKKGDKKELLTTQNGISTIIMTDGKIVYYSVANSSNMNEYCTDTIYKKILSTGQTRKLFSVKNEYYFSFVGYYQEKIYYIKNLDPGTLCSYDLKTGKNKSLLKNVTGVDQYGSVFLCTPYEGGGGPFEFTTYNAKTNKSKILTKSMMNYKVIKKQVYYVEYVRSYDNSEYILYNDYICNVVRCDLNGKNKKVLLKNQRIKGYVDKITSSYLTYKNYDSNKTYKIKYK
ncbi:MAG: hypothetical protein J6C00_01845 [Eubacterium sp.]|nr:hypothetical protein [Eubacterium sp.]